VSFIKAGLSALGKLAVVVVLAGAFLFGMVGVVYLSLRGEEVKVPEVIGKDFYDSEKLIAGLGLKIKKRATRFSEERPNTILEQLPRPGDTVKTGQTILVVISEANAEKNEAPATIKKETVDTPLDEGTDITPDKPVKTNKNTNVKKPAQTTRDVLSNKPVNKNANAGSGGSDSAGSNKSSETNKSTGNKNASTSPPVKPAPTPADKPEPAKPSATKSPAPAKTPSSGETRTRRVP
jgi:beta-lactam-binding protein with PASTA domain